MNRGRPPQSIGSFGDGLKSLLILALGAAFSRANSPLLGVTTQLS